MNEHVKVPLHKLPVGGAWVFRAHDGLLKVVERTGDKTYKVYTHDGEGSFTEEDCTWEQAFEHITGVPA